MKRISLLTICGAALAASTCVAQEATFGTTVVIPGGLRGQIYFLPAGTSKLPDFQSLEPQGTIFASTLNLAPQSFDQGFPGVSNRFEWFAIDYSGNFWIDEPGLYRFELASDDGAKLWIDDQLIADNDGQHEPITRSASLRLAYGVHRIRISYFQGPRYQVALSLMVAPPGKKLRPFNTDAFKPPSNPELWKQLAPEPASDRMAQAKDSGLTATSYPVRRGVKRVHDLKKSKPLGTASAHLLDTEALAAAGAAKCKSCIVEFTGKFWLDAPGLYEFALSSNNGSLLAIDDQLIADNHAPQTGGAERHASLQLTRGMHSIQLMYAKALESAPLLSVMLAPPGESLRLFDTDELKPPADLATP